MSFLESIKKCLFQSLKPSFELADYQQHITNIAAMVRHTGDPPSPNKYDTVELAFDVYRKQHPGEFTVPNFNLVQQLVYANRLWSAMPHAVCAAHIEAILALIPPGGTPRRPPDFEPVNEANEAFDIYQRQNTNIFSGR